MARSIEVEITGRFAEVKVIRLEPSDVIVLELADNPPLEQVFELKAMLEREFPDHRCLIVHGSIKVVRADDAPRGTKPEAPPADASNRSS